MNILLVEDDCASQDALTLLLEDEGYTVQTARHGQAALTLLAAPAELPDVIVLDLTMPVMNGWEFRAAQQADLRIAGIPVVVLSADRGVAHKAASLTADAFVGKPVLMDQLVPILERFAP